MKIECPDPVDAFAEQSKELRRESGDIHLKGGKNIKLHNSEKFRLKFNNEDDPCDDPCDNVFVNKSEYEDREEDYEKKEIPNKLPFDDIKKDFAKETCKGLRAGKVLKNYLMAYADEPNNAGRLYTTEAIENMLKKFNMDGNVGKVVQGKMDEEGYEMYGYYEPSRYFDANSGDAEIIGYFDNLKFDQGELTCDIHLWKDTKFDKFNICVVGRQNPVNRNNKEVFEVQDLDLVALQNAPTTSFGETSILLDDCRHVIDILRKRIDSYDYCTKGLIEIIEAQKGKIDMLQRTVKACRRDIIRGNEKKKACRDNKECCEHKHTC